MVKSMSAVVAVFIYIHLTLLFADLLDDIMAIYAGTQFSCITMMNFHAEEDSTFENRVLYDTCLYIYIKTVNSVKPAP